MTTFIFSSRHGETYKIIGRNMATIFQRDTQYKLIRTERERWEQCAVIRVLTDAFNKGHYFFEARDAWHWRDCGAGVVLTKLLPEEIGQLMGGN